MSFILVPTEGEDLQVNAWNWRLISMPTNSIQRHSNGFLVTADTNEVKIAALAELICRAGDEAGTKSAALLVLMSTLENAPHPKALANLAKHLAFTRCSELNLNGMVEAQIEVFESELLASNTLVS